MALLVVGLLLGTVFTFGMQYWSETVTREECLYIETQFLDYKEIKQRSRINQIAIDCADGERYFIDQVSINTRLREYLAELEKNDNITMLIHPNGGNIIDLRSGILCSSTGRRRSSNCRVVQRASATSRGGRGRYDVVSWNLL